MYTCILTEFSIRVNKNSEVITMKHRIVDIEYNGGYDVYEDPADYIEDISDFYVESWDADIWGV